MIITKVELDQIALQMRFADMLINAVNAALQDRKESFRTVFV